ncbi:protein of unknown function [Burkholderia multivorans]
MAALDFSLCCERIAVPNKAHINVERNFTLFDYVNCRSTNEVAKTHAVLCERGNEFIFQFLRHRYSNV